MRIRVLHLIKGLGRGGAETLLAEGLRSSDRERFEYAYGYFLPWKDHLVGELREEGARVHCFHARSSAGVVGRTFHVVRYIRDHDVHVIHCHLPVSGVVGRVAGRLTGVPVVYTEHNVLERYHPLTRAANLATWRWQARVITVSRDVAASLERRKAAGVPVELVLNGVDTEKFRRRDGDGAAVRRRFGIPERARVVGTVAVFRTQKRLDLWLQAARKVLDRYPDTRFLLVGDGPERERLMGLACELGLDGAAHFSGLQEEVGPFLAAMDVYMMSSRFEGLPVALLEAMAMECAVVATEVGGIPEAIDGENGRLVPFGDVRALAEAASTLFESNYELSTLGAAARRVVTERFSMSRMQRRIEGIYEDVLAEES